MKRFIIILVLTTVCGTSMADISTDIESWYEDLLEFFDLYKDREEILEKVDAYNEMMEPSYTSTTQSYTSLLNNDTDLPLPEYTRDSRNRIDPDQGSFENPDSPVISNPEPCSIILSSIGLGVVGFLKRRRAI